MKDKVRARLFGRLDLRGSMRVLAIGLAAVIVVIAAASAARAADDSSATISTLRKQIEALQQQGQQNQQLIEELKKRVADLEAKKPAAEATPAPKAPESPESALDRAVEDINVPATPTTKAASSDLASVKAGKAEIKLIDISMDILVAGGASSAPPSQIPILQGGDHDPSRNGFSLQQAEISASGAVDPYFYGESHIVFKEDGVEIEEAFATTLNIPAVQFKAGYYLTEFGRTNATHPHTWDYITQPVPITRMFGGDGQRGCGVRIGWLMPTPWYSQLLVNMQNATGEQMPSFLGTPNGAVAAYQDAGALSTAGYKIGIAGRPIFDRGVDKAGDFVYSGRWENSWSPGDSSVLLGFSGERGPNETGLQGYAWIYGADFLVRWRPAVNEYGWPFISWQTEFIGRDYHAQEFTANGIPTGTAKGTPLTTNVNLPARDFNDWGVFSILTWGFVRDWALTLRGEYATAIDTDSADRLARKLDPLRDDRTRLAAAFIFNPTHFSRLRLEYDHDIATHLKTGEANSVWLSLEILYGAHPAHNF
jgi:cell division protein FtsB